MGLKGCFKFFFRRAFEITLIALAIIYIPNIPPYASNSESYRLPPSKSLTGKLAVNNKLDDVEIWHKGDLHGPECIIDYNGELYTGLLGGDIVKLVGKDHIVPVIKFGKPCSEYYEEKTCGRPLGFQFDKNGYLYAADAYYGLWKADLKTGKKELLVSPNEKIDGKVPKIFNSIALASNGDIYFSHSSSQFDLQDGVFDIMSDPTGRLIRYDAKTKTKTVLIDKLAFANGVILSDDEEFVLVAETMKNRIHRYYLKGPKKGTHDLFVDALPGLTDNLSSDGKGGFIVPLVMATDEDHPMLNQMLTPFPSLRKLITRLFGISQWIFETIDRYYPNEFAKKAVFSIGHFTSMPSLLNNKRVTILRLSKNGEIIDSIHTMNKKISHVCEAHVFQDTLYLGSFSNDYIAKIPLSKIGWEDLKRDSQPKREAKPIAQEKRQVPTQAPKVQITTPPPPKQEPQVKKETVQAQKQTPPPVKKETVTPKPTTQPPQQQEAEKQAPPPKAQTPPPRQETQAPNKAKPTTTPKPQVKQAAPQKVETKTEKSTTQKPQTAPPKKATPAAATQKVEKESTNQKVDSKPQQAPSTQQKPPAAAQKPTERTQKPQASPQQPKETPQKPPATAQKAQAVPQQAQAAPQQAQAAPQQARAAPQQAQAAPQQAQAAPQQAQATPQRAQATPQKEPSKQAPPQKEPPKQAPPPNKAPPVAQPVKEQVNTIPVKEGTKK